MIALIILLYSYTGNPNSDQGERFSGKKWHILGESIVSLRFNYGEQL
jgi:hypothetical protein